MWCRSILWWPALAYREIRVTIRFFKRRWLFQPPLTSPADDWSLHVMESDVRDAVGSSKFDISIELDERPEGHVAGGFVFSADLFDRETAREMALHWCRLLDAVAAAPEYRWPNMIWLPRMSAGRQLSWNLTTQHGISSHMRARGHQLAGRTYARRGSGTGRQHDPDLSATGRPRGGHRIAVGAGGRRARHGGGRAPGPHARSGGGHSGNSQIRRGVSAAGSPPAGRPEHLLHQRRRREHRPDRSSAADRRGGGHGHRHQPRRSGAACTSAGCPVKHRVFRRPRLRDLHVRLHRPPEGGAHRASQRHEPDAHHVSRVWRRCLRHRAVGGVHQL